MSFTAHVAGAVAGIAIAATVILPASDRTPPITVTEFSVVNPEVAPGDRLLTLSAVTRKHVCETTVFATLYDGAGIEWPYAPDNRPAFGPEGDDVRITGHTIPIGATPGPSRYRVVLEFNCHWPQGFWPVTLVLPDLDFTILPTGAPE